MNNKLAFRYDREGDVLYVDTCPAYTEQESEELGDEVVVRLNPDTGAVENVEILFFSTRLLRRDLLEAAHRRRPADDGGGQRSSRGERAMNPDHLGSDFDDFLREEGLLKEAEVVARERIDRARRQAAGPPEPEIDETEP